MARSGQITVTTAGTAVQGPDQVGKEFLVAPHPGNTGAYIWLGNDDAASPDVSSANGFPVIAGGPVVHVHVNNLKELWFDVQTNGDKVCWLKVR
jgi:hypothetical protein